MRYDNDRELVRSLEDVVLLKDRFDLPVTCAAAAAVEDYMAAIDLLLSAWPGAEVLLDRALAADPEFALAHIARARLLQLQARMPEAKAAAGALGGSRTALPRASAGTSTRSRCRSTAPPATHWRSCALTP